MRHEQAIRSDRTTHVEYQQFRAGRKLRFAMTLARWATWPLALPLAALSRLSDVLFVSCSQLLAIVPFAVGVILRGEFYRFALTECGTNVMVGFGTIFLYRDIRIGSNVFFGSYNTVHHCDIGAWALIADGCRLLSGPANHNYQRTDLPMALQGGELRRIVLGEDTWIGANAVLMNDVGRGSIVAAGAVVTNRVEPYTIVGGVPARVLARRTGKTEGEDPPTKAPPEDVGPGSEAD
jgi:acetyltransferase-like isoleucine patch superfamily enzyme